MKCGTKPERQLPAVCSTRAARRRAQTSMRWLGLRQILVHSNQTYCIAGQSGDTVHGCEQRCVAKSVYDCAKTREGPGIWVTIRSWRTHAQSMYANEPRVLQSCTRIRSSVVFDVLDRVYDLVHELERHAWNDALCVGECTLQGAQCYPRLLRSHAREELRGRQQVPLQGID